MNGSQARRSGSVSVAVAGTFGSNVVPAQPLPSPTDSVPEPSPVASTPASGETTTTPVEPTELVNHVSASTAFGIALLVAITAAVIGMIIIWARTGFSLRANRGQRGARGAKTLLDNDDKSVMRAWLALALVIGLLVFAAMTFALDDAQLRSMLIGGLVASAGSAIAYYFSSKDADSARKDILGAVFPMTTVPDVMNMSPTDARSKVESAGLTLAIHPAAATGNAVLAQTPSANSSARRGDVVHVDVAP